MLNIQTLVQIVEVGKIDGHQKRIGAKVVSSFYDPENKSKIIIQFVK